jgi:2-iminoacetate synthase
MQVIINKDILTSQDFAALLSVDAAKHIEAMAQKAHALTIQHFGNTIQLYTPLYLSDYCENECVYCGFNITNSFARKKLSLDDVEKEAKAIAALGFKHILILTGESRRMSSVEYLKECVFILKKYFSSISIEVYPLEEAEYRELVLAGVDGLTIYQETYNRGLYDQLHKKGPKKDYDFRLFAPVRAARAGMNSINLGALLGLDDWRKEVYAAGLHAYELQNQYPNVEVSLSFPRIRPNLSGFKPAVEVADSDLVQAITAVRLFMPRCGITISTRESGQFRDNVLPLGVTRMSAQSATCVGGHAEIQGEGQFNICDDRSLCDVKTAITARGYQAVMKNW